MSGRDMIVGVREILHDTGRGLSTDDRMYDTREIVRRLNEAKERIGKTLINAPKPAHVGVNRLAKLKTATSPDVAATDLMKLFGAIRSDNSFIATAPFSIAEPMVGVGHDYAYAESGSVYGPFSLYGYWQKASEVIADSTVALTEFSDSIYYVIQILAARELLPQEKADAVDRWKLLTQMLTEEMGTFD